MPSLWDSPDFFLLLGALVALFVSLGPAKRWFPVLVLGLYFLFWFNGLIALNFIALSLLNFIITRKGSPRGPLFILGLSTNLFFLFYYKYLNFFLPVTSEFYLKIVLPLGTSFFVFQQLSYLIDVHRSDEARIDHLGKYLTYSFLFLNFSTGPIERSNKIVEKLHSLPLPDISTVRAAALLIYWGLFKKMAVADHLTPLVSKLFSQSSYFKEDILPGFLLNKYEIYANFSGYTDMVLGAGLLLGIKFTPNFKRPFSALSIVDYWKRWHLSLSYWIRDYVYYPLSLSSFSRLGSYFILLITFLVFSLWHDLRSTFLIYAVVQVVLIFFSHKLGSFGNTSQRAFVKMLRRAWLYCVLISLPSILFRSHDLNQAIHIFRSLFALGTDDYIAFVKSLGGPMLGVLLLVLFCEYIEKKREEFDLVRWLEKRGYWTEVGCYLFALLLFLVLAKFDSSTGFIYGHY